MAKQYSQAEVDALLARASGADPATRPYQVIAAADGQVVCYPPVGTPNAVAGQNGPWTIGGEHPDDWFGVEFDDKGKAKVNDKGQAIATKGV
jgi:hypothetical protein